MDYALPDGTPAALLIVEASQRERHINQADGKSDDELFDHRTAFSTFSYARETKEHYEHRTHLASAWDSQGFAVRVSGADYVNKLRAVFEAIQQHDLALAGSLISKNSKGTMVGGLTLAIGSRISPDMKQKALKEDHLKLKLQKTADPVMKKLKKLLEQNNKKFFSLRPA